MKSGFVSATKFCKIEEKLLNIHVLRIEDLLINEFSSKEKVSRSFNYAQAACPDPFPLMALIMAAAAGAPWIIS